MQRIFFNLVFPSLELIASVQNITLLLALRQEGSLIEEIWESYRALLESFMAECEVSKK